MIRITSKRQGFRRCGVAHPKAPTEYHDERFSKKELKILNDEAMLTVEHVEDEIITTTPLIKDMTVAALKEMLDKLAVAYDAKARKDDLIALAEASTAEPKE